MVLGISGFELMQNGEKMFIVKGDLYYLVDVGIGSVNLNVGKIDLSGCKFFINLREDWK